MEKRYLRGKAFSLIDKDTLKRMISIWSDAKDDLQDADRRLLEAVGVISDNAAVIDERIQKVRSFLEGSHTVPEDIMEQLCNETCLSKSRLSHLFKEQMGIALGRYLVIEKMKKGYLHYCKNGNITNAALNAGFDSPSHFAATCKRMFGISLGGYLAPRAAAFDKRITKVVAWSVFPCFQDILVSMQPKNVRSLTFRLFTDKEDAQNHCNVGNGKLAVDEILDWICRINAQRPETN